MDTALPSGRTPTAASHPGLQDRQQPAGFEPVVDDIRIAEFLGFSIKTIQRMCRNAELPGFKIGKSWFFRVSEFNNWLRLQSESRIARAV